MAQFPSWGRREAKARSYRGPDAGGELERSSRVFAISFDLMIDAIRAHYRSHETQAYHDIRRVLESHNFTHMQGSLYFSRPNGTAVDVFVAIKDLQETFPWFDKVVRDLRMFRIEENNDLMPLIGQQKLFPKKAANE